MYERAAKTGNLIHRVSTLLGTLLTVVFFLQRGRLGILHMVLFLVWMVLGVYSSVKTLADMASGRRAREANFQRMLQTWEGRTGAPSSALVAFWTITGVTAAVKLGVPFLLWLV